VTSEENALWAEARANVNAAQHMVSRERQIQAIYDWANVLGDLTNRHGSDIARQALQGVEALALEMANHEP
jgi:hypothetical protein